MQSNATLNSNVFSMLDSIIQCAESLSECHLSRQYDNTDYGRTLGCLVASALRDLSKCIDIINSRAPVSNLTQDVLSVIFHEVVQDNLAAPDHKGTWYPPSIPAPLCLSHVSKSWKAVATNLPTLWTTVKVTTPWSLASIKTCLLMSVPLPIDLYIKGLKWKHRDLFIDSIPDDYEEDIPGLWCILSPHIHRCRSIYITLDTTFWSLLVEIEDQFCSREVPLLETLSIVGTSPFDEGLEDPVDLFPHGAPRLKDVRLTVDTLARCRPPFDSITSLSLKGSGSFVIDEVVSILSGCVNLETLNVYGDLTPGGITLSKAVPSLKLRSIRLYDSRRPTIELLLDLFQAPSLVELYIDPYRHLEWMSLRTITGRLPFPSLKTLTISPYLTGNTTSEAMCRTLNDASSSFPHIESLALVGKNSRLMLRSLAGINDAKGWPSLQNLILPRIPDEDSGNALCEFVTLRKAAGVALPKILFNGESLRRFTCIDWLKAHVDVVENCTTPLDSEDLIFPEIKDDGFDHGPWNPFTNDG